MMRILVFGANGQVGREVCKRDAGYEIIPVTRDQVDLMHPGAAEAFIKNASPDAIINAAAYTDVDDAESNASIADRINAGAVKEIAQAAKINKAAFVHISTDYVFAGDGAVPLTENNPVNPLNTYGRSKLNGETLAMAVNPQSVILRTSWVYSAHGKNFLKTMLRLSAEREELTIVSDQIGGPSPAEDIAAAALKIIQTQTNGTQHNGIYHFQGAPAVSWADFAVAIFNAAQAATTVKNIPTSAYKTPAERPLFTVLDCSRILRDFGIEQPDWRKGLPALIDVLKSTD